MENIPTYIYSSANTKGILPSSFLLLEKYWTLPKNIKVVGDDLSGVELPSSEYTKIESGAYFNSSHPASRWSKDLIEFLANETSDLVILMLDDMWIIDKTNPAILQFFVNKMRSDPSIIRCDLSMDLMGEPHHHKTLCTINDYEVIEKVNTYQGYWHSTQPSLWRKSYLINLLYKTTTPWDFEMMPPTFSTPIRVLGTKGKFAIRTITESAISSIHKGKVNILGLRFKDVAELLFKGLVQEEDLQYGMKPGNIPQFKDFGYEFHPRLLKDPKILMRYESQY